MTAALEIVKSRVILGIVQNENPHAVTGDMKMVDFLCINPSIEISDLVSRHIDSLPRSMRTILRMTGATPAGGGTSMASYLLFEGAFCRELIDCGYRDAMAQEDALVDFFYPQREVRMNGETRYASESATGG